MLKIPSRAISSPQPYFCCHRCFGTSAPRQKGKYASDGRPLTPRPGARSRPYAVQDDGPLPLTAEQKESIEAARTARAERQERMDITAALTPVKTFMGGFTAPKKLRTLDRMDTHFYTKRPRPERKPPANAYTPHCVYGFVSRHPVWQGHGTATARVIETGMCSASNFKQTLAHFNGAAVDPRPKTEGNEEAEEDEEGEENEEHEAEEESEQPEADDDAPPLRTGLEVKARKFSNLTRKQKKKERAKIPLTYTPASVQLPPMAREARNAAMNAIWGGKEWIDERNKLRNEKAKEHTTFMNSLPPDAFPPPEYQRPPIPEGSNGPWPVWDDKSPHLPLNVPLPPYTDPPFFTPLFVFTFPTRPLAATIKRLQTGLERGLPYYASIPDKDRKDGPSFFRRKLRLRMDRLQRLIRHMARILAGGEGGFVGIRFHQEDLGRLMKGERLMEGIEKEKRRIEVRWGEDALDFFGHGKGWEGVAEGWEGIPELYWGKMDQYGNPIGECEAVPGAEERQAYMDEISAEQREFSYAVESRAVPEEFREEEEELQKLYTADGKKQTVSGTHWVVRRSVPVELRRKMSELQEASWNSALKTLREPTLWTGRPEGREDDPEWAWDTSEIRGNTQKKKTSQPSTTTESTAVEAEPAAPTQESSETAIEVDDRAASIDASPSSSGAALMPTKEQPQRVVASN